MMIKRREVHLVQNSMVSTEAMLTVASVATLIRRASRSGDISSPILIASRTISTFKKPSEF